MTWFKTFRIPIASLLVLLNLFLLAGCYPQKPEIQTFPEHGAYPVVIQNITLQQRPEHLVSLGSDITQTLIDLGWGSQLVAVSEDSLSLEGVSQLPFVGTAACPDWEQILLLTPDLVITEEPVSKKAFASLSEEGIQILVLSSDDELMETLKLLDGNPNAVSKQS